MLRIIVAGLVLCMFCTHANAVTADEALSDLIAADKYDEAVRNIDQFPSSHLHELIIRAREQLLWNDPIWKKLLHYKKNIWGGYTSQVDGKDFFNSSEGKNNPEAEMEATLARFFSTKPVAPTTLLPQCRFIARYQWLKNKLGFNLSRMPDDKCLPFEELIDALRPEAISIIFPSAHPNSPSSMFGHTFMRIDRKGQTRETRMLDFTINYAAQIEDQNTLMYAVNGLTGGFEGRYNVLPFHLKLREYVQMENRDLWEYKLNLTQQQVEMILQHAYELLPTYFDYYFFTENCAYHLLSLLEVAFPDKDLTGEFPGWTIPVDTLKLLDQKYGMVTGVNYQPSHKAVILSRRAALTSQENDLAARTYRNGMASTAEVMQSLEPERQAAIMDLAFDYLRYAKIKNADTVGTELTQVERDLLLARSKIKVRSTPPQVNQPAVSPDHGHETSRFSVSAGVSEKINFTQLGWRAAYHDLMDSSPGYAWNSKLDFFNIELRQYAENKQTVVHQFTLIDILSLEPRDDFFNHISWHVDFGWKERNTRGIRHGALVMEGGPGLTYEFPLFQRSLAYGLIQASGEYSRKYSDKLLGATGFLGGLLLKINPVWTAQLEFNTQNGMGNDVLDSRQAALRQNFELSTNLSLGIDISQNKSAGRKYTEASGAVRIYF